MRILTAILAMLAVALLSSCETFNKGADYYQSRVESQSFQVTVDGQSKHVTAGTTVTFRQPGEAPVKVSVQPVANGVDANGNKVPEGGK